MGWIKMARGLDKVIMVILGQVRDVTPGQTADIKHL